MEEGCNRHLTAPARPVSGQIVNYSIDDVYEVLQELTEHSADYAGIFDCKRLAALRELHRKYGAKFSMFCFEEAIGYHISSVTTKFQREFRRNSDWLKFGYHGKDYQTKFHQEYPLKDFGKSYENVERAIAAFAGEISLCHTIRLHFFMCTEEAKVFLREKGIVGLLAADDARVSYDLSKEESACLDKERLFEKGLSYYKTDMRLEHVEDMQASLRSMQGLERVVIFTHEYELGHQLGKLEEAIRFFSQQGYVSSFFE